MKEKNAEQLWILFEPFAGYGFNKAHAACYATIAFRTAYLKAHYPVEFMTALLTAESRGSSGPTKNEKVALAVSECKRIKVIVLQPDINKSGKEFTIEKKVNIRFGLSAIKNVGDAAIKNILDQREKEEFKSFEDFLTKVDLSTINKKTIESLIKSGAMDLFGKRAKLLIDNEKLAFEKEFLGLYLTSHPQLDNLLKIKDKITIELESLSEEQEGSRVIVGGIIEAIRRIFTKSGSEMAFVTLANEKGGSVECVVFPKIYEQYKSIIDKDSILIISGRIDTKNDKPVLIAEKISTFNHFSS
jgi:DNA polymerase-3 subunit alpha